MQAIDIIILAAVAVLLLLALRSTLRHYSGKGGGCCGCSGCSGNSSCSMEDSIKTAEGIRKAVGEDTLSRTLQISGMHCSTCKQSVESALTSVNGVICADVNLESGTAKVFLKEEVEDSFLKKAVEDKGFEVKGIQAAPCC